MASGEREWTYPLCGCFSDCSTCLLAWCCPCILVGNIAEVVDQDKTLCLLASLASLIFFPLAYVGIRIFLRNKLREQKAIEGSIVKDCLCVYFCDLCALTQEAREIKDQPYKQMMARE